MVTILNGWLRLNEYNPFIKWVICYKNFHGIWRGDFLLQYEWRMQGIFPAPFSPTLSHVFSFGIIKKIGWDEI